MNNKNKTAILLGASGLVGSSLLKLLLANDLYKHVKVFVRTDLGINHPKLTVYVVDFNKPDSYKEKVTADELFCCLGTTIKQAGSQEAFRRVDYTYPVTFAEIAKANGIRHYLLVSSIGANASSSVFYLRTKGECENDIRKTGIENISVFRPASLSGNRKVPRMGETISLAVLKAFSFLLIGKLRKYRPVNVTKVAEAMIKSAAYPKVGFTVYESDEINR